MIPESTIEEIRRATDIVARLRISIHHEYRTDLAKAIRELSDTLGHKERDWWNSSERATALRKERQLAEQKKKAKKSLEARVAEWAEENLKEGDFVKFLGTRGDQWRLVHSIERTSHPDYYASRVHGSIIKWKHTTIKYAAYTFTGSSSVNGMEKIDIVVRNGVEVFNRKSVHSKKQQND